jgi:hypothetical protein
MGVREVNRLVPPKLRDGSSYSPPRSRLPGRVGREKRDHISDVIRLANPLQRLHRKNGVRRGHWPHVADLPPSTKMI